MKKGQAKRFYVFGIFRIDVTERVLLSEKGSVSLTPKAFDLLLFLLGGAHAMDRQVDLRSVEVADHHLHISKSKAPRDLLAHGRSRRSGQRQAHRCPESVGLGAELAWPLPAII